ncbi:MAG: B12-binding domain-containing protein [Ilumatobacteraceae bacterium]
MSDDVDPPREDDDLSLQTVADLLGVHYMTAYRYVRHGMLPAVKLGGTWRVSRVDFDKFQSGTPPEPTDGESKRRRAPWSDRLEARLIAGDGRGAWGVIEMALASGASLDEVYIDIISPAMQSIGAKWAAGKLDIAVEHRATGIALRLIGRLGPRFSRRGRTRGTIVIGAPPGERHSLPISLVADLLRGNGWEVSDLGADMPVDSFVRAALECNDLAAVAVSVTSAEWLESAGDLVVALKSALAEHGARVIIGGAAVVDEDHARQLGADAWAPSARALIALLDGGSAEGSGSAGY